MKVTGVQWDRGNVRHFSEHGRCKRGEVEDVLTSRCHPSRARDQAVEPGEEQRKLFEGQTCADRFLTVVAAPKPDGVMRPITCWPLTGRPREKYLAWRGSLPR
jgi:hypothetical protein